MSELIYNQQEFIEAVGELIPAFQRKKIISFIESSQDNEIEYDQMGLSLTGEKKELSFIIPTSAPNNSDGSLWGAVKREVYDYMCTTSRKYSKERGEAGTTIKQLITILATAIASSFHIAIGVVTGAVTIALLSVLKIGKNAWCKVNTPE